MSKSRRRDDESMQKGIKAIIDLMLNVFFWLALIGECYALYTKNYQLRFYTRTLLVPMAFMRIFNKEVFFSMHFFVYLCLLLSWFGDILNLIVDIKIQYLASAIYTFSYLSFGIVFYNFLKKKWMFVNYIFYTFFAIVGVIVFFVFYFPTLSDTLTKIHLVIHGIVLLFALIWAFTIRKDLGNIAFKYFIPSVVLMLIANVLYAFDFYYINTWGSIHYFFKRHTSVDVVVAICYGLYIYLFTQGIKYLKYAKAFKKVEKEMPVEAI